MSPAVRPRRRRALALALAAATLLLFAPALRNGFVNLDDPNQLTGNSRLAAGIGTEGLRWALTSFEHANWHPLTWAVRLLTVQLLGLEPAGHHLVSLLAHAAAAACLFLALSAATGSLAAPALAAALFALHPLRVESVAWAAELKDPLCGLFFALALLAHLRLAARPGPGRYAALLVAVAAALLAKPTAVVLPPLLLLLDWWPLGRFRSSPRPARTAALLFAEKLPLLALAAGASALTLHAQGLAGAVRSYEHPLSVRAGNAAVSLVAYLAKTLWPLELSVFYPHPGASLPAAAAVAAALGLLALSLLAACRRNARPYAAAGWAWYLVAVAPTAGVVQAGFQASADRYTYLPLIGPVFAAAFAVADRTLLPRVSARVRWGGAAAFLAFCAALTPAQIAVWRDSQTLFTHALALEPDNWLAHLKLGEAARAAGDRPLAIAHLRQAVRLEPGNIHARTVLGVTLGESGDDGAAVAELREALRRNPWWADAHFNLGIALLRTGRPTEAAAAFGRDAALRPLETRSLPYLVLSALALGDLEEAARGAAAYLAREPGSARAHHLQGLALEARGDAAAAAAAHRRALSLEPGLRESRAALERLGNRGSAPR